ncbi:MAG: hypothetical protein CVT67_01220 [Actinobacteria bacterium HGW-Actinobacteria-7]|nr:MAG: hypothetical protein CVT67_01220 [Actinobacteria bacterium HGW-Actinobacteria-7]
MDFSLSNRLRACALILATAVVFVATLVSPSPAVAVDPLFTFNGGGWGHGIGLSQYGAQGYALKGWEYDDILKHYYQGTKIVTKPAATVKVNLEDGGSARSQWQIKAGSVTTLTVAQETNTSVRKVLDKTKSYWITTVGGNTKVCADSAGKPGTVLQTFSGGCYATAGGFVQMVGTSGPLNYSGIRWRGTIHFKPYTTTTSKAVNYVNIEQYLYGVVPRESPSSWSSEALKAQAVAARSYAYQDAIDGNTLYCTTRSQMYNGYARPGYNHEASSTNAAVDATKGELVWYGTETKPVKTYFSSCSGGHTASIQDVWTSSTPKPYYTGVDDADQASPYYTWRNGAYSAAYVADKIRTRDINGGGGLEYSVAAPAVVTNITTERASSGYTHHLSVTWSNGKTFRILGDTMRSALGLKSTKFGVSRTYPVQATTRFQNSDAKLAWSGYWVTQSRSELSGGTLSYSAISRSTAKASFSGTGIAWIGTRGPKFGKAAVYVDGKLNRTVDLYSKTTAYRQSVFNVTALSPGTHVIEIVVLRQKNSASGGYLVGVDALDVINGSMSQATAELKRFEDTDTTFALLGQWKSFSNIAYSAGRHIYTVDPGARFYATFYGSEVRWIGSSSPKYGWALVSVDGSAPQKIVITSSAYEYKKVLFAKTGLSQGKKHTIMIEAHGFDEAVDIKGYTAIDAIDVRGGWVLRAVIPEVTVQETDSAATWTGTWSQARSRLLSGGTQKYSKIASSEMVLTFEGTGIRLMGRRAPWYGQSRIYLDGIYQGTVDQYSRYLADRRTLWRSPQVAVGRHELRIVVKGTKQKASSGVGVGIDAFRVAGRAVRP